MQINPFEINKKVNLEQLGKIIREAIDYHEDQDHDAVRDMLLELYSMVYPNARRMLTQEEMDAYCAAVKAEETAATGYSPLLLDESDVPDPQAPESIKLLKQTLGEIIDGERAPSALLEAMEITWKIAHDCALASDHIEAITNRNKQLQQQNQTLANLLKLHIQDQPAGQA